MPAPDLRGADIRPDPQIRSAHGTTALDPGRTRSRPGRPGRRPAGRRPRRVREPEHGLAPGQHASRAGSAGAAGGRRRRVRNPQGPPLRHCPGGRRNPLSIDLLPDRETSSLAAWLAQRPGVEVVCRDRAPFFAEGAAAGAPQAVQVADRWHLWYSLSEAAERSVAQHRRCLHVLTPAASEPQPATVPAVDPSTSPWPRGHRFADRTRSRHAAVHALLKAGHSQRSIQRQLGMTWRTVKQFAEVATPEELFTGQWQNRPSVLDDYKPYLDDRWNEGCTNAWKLWEEIVPLGYKGSYQRVRAYLHDKRTSPRPVTARPPSPRAVAGWILRHPDTLAESEQLQLKAVRTRCPELDALTRHVRSFATMLTERQGERLPDWLDAVRQDDLPSLHTLAAGIDRDRDAVIAGLTLPWNSGVVEGHVNRIKMLKRQMFGRAGFDVLRKRVLLAP
ncbi:ISL3 family transposase [Streptomyces sp. NPDC006539]|uniref:ISL3 family transposase n=1 Tax=Streptomyces sp. NPDC006539 TaxID=3155352 RepID=UPI0033BE7547